MMASDVVSDLAIEALQRAGRSAWPTVLVSAEALARHVARLAEDGAYPAAEGAAHAADLYLACACAEGLAPAIAAFDEAYLSQVPHFVARTDSSPELAAEVRQHLRERLLVASPGERPRIARYSGRGPLGGWVRMAAVRAAVDLKRAMGRGVGRRDVPDLVDEKDPEVELVRARYGVEYRAALAEAWALLSPRDRNLLRLHYVDGSSIDRLAVHYQAHRATAARWLVSARAELLAHVRRLLSTRLAISAAELDSIANAVRDELHLSLGPLSIDVP